MMRTRTLVWLVPSLFVACGGSQSPIGDAFNTQWQNDGGKSIRAVQVQLADKKISKGADVAVGIVKQGLVGVQLESGETWRFEHAIDARPHVAGDVVVGTGGGKLFALEAETGRKLWARPASGKLRGAGDDGRLTLVSIEPSQGVSRLLAVGRDGTVARQIDTDVAVGTPAVVAGHAFLPWQNQYVSVYDLAEGIEDARVILRHQTSHAFVQGGSLYFGEVGATRFDERIGDAARDQASKVVLPARELPGKPRWLGPGGFAGKTSSDALDAIRAYARPEPEQGGLGLDQDRYYVTYYRIVAGLQEGTGELAWVQELAHDVIGGAAYDGGVALCQRSGDVAFFDAVAGAPAGKASLGEPVEACVVQADRMSPRAEVSRSEPLAEQIAQVIDVTETEMVMMHGFLLRELIAQESPRATERLIELALDARTPPDLMQEVRTGLASRRNGAQHMLKALERRYDYLAGVTVPPPVGPLADALAQMDEAAAAPLLVKHLNDPANSTDDVKRAAMALEKLATPAQADELASFLALYRATAHDDDMLAAVVAVAKVARAALVARVAAVAVVRLEFM
ncbi:MAG: PQQ-binding-like beta-propeller repeat protein [Myxococcota bacterium]